VDVFVRWEKENMRVCEKCGDDFHSRAEAIKSLPLVEFWKLVVYGHNELFDVLRGEPALLKEVENPSDNARI